MSVGTLLGQPPKNDCQGFPRYKLTLERCQILLYLIALAVGISVLVAAQKLKLSYEDAARVAMIGDSNHFEVAIATAFTLFGLNSGTALATIVGVLIEVPVMLMLVEICKRTAFWVPREPEKESLRNPAAKF